MYAFQNEEKDDFQTCIHPSDFLSFLPKIPSLMVNSSLSTLSPLSSENDPFSFLCKTRSRHEFHSHPGGELSPREHILEGRMYSREEFTEISLIWRRGKQALYWSRREWPRTHHIQAMVCLHLIVEQLDLASTNSYRRDACAEPARAPGPGPHPTWGLRHTLLFWPPHIPEVPSELHRRLRERLSRSASPDRGPRRAAESGQDLRIPSRVSESVPWGGFASNCAEEGLSGSYYSVL